MNNSWTVMGILKWAADFFRAKGVSEPRASAEVLLAHALNLSRLDLYLRHDQPLTPEELARFKALIIRRRHGEPPAYITGRKEFWSLDFKVTPAVLIPRPETEILVQALLEASQPKTGYRDQGSESRVRSTHQNDLTQSRKDAKALTEDRVPKTEYRDQGSGISSEFAVNETPSLSMPWIIGDLKDRGHDPGARDQGPAKEIGGQSQTPKTENRKPKTDLLWGLEVGTGSGAVVIALARELPEMRWVGIDISDGALTVARDNARRHGVAERIHFIRGDLMSGIKAEPRFHLVAANLPYVPRPVWEHLPADIKDFEPREALLGGDDGLALLSPLISQAHRVLASGGRLALEVADGMAPKVVEMLQETEAYRSVEILKDYQGADRVVLARRMG